MNDKIDYPKVKKNATVNRFSQAFILARVVDLSCYSVFSKSTICMQRSGINFYRGRFMYFEILSYCMSSFFFTGFMLCNFEEKFLWLISSFGGKITDTSLTNFVTFVSFLWLYFVRFATLIIAFGVIIFRWLSRYGCDVSVITAIDYMIALIVIKIVRPLIATVFCT